MLRRFGRRSSARDAERREVLLFAVCCSPFVNRNGATTDREGPFSLSSLCFGPGPARGAGCRHGPKSWVAGRLRSIAGWFSPSWADALLRQCVALLLSVGHSGDLSANESPHISPQRTQGVHSHPRRGLAIGARPPAVRASSQERCGIRGDPQKNGRFMGCGRRGKDGRAPDRAPSPPAQC